MLTCHDTSFLLSQSRERPLTLPERMKLRIHLAMCRGCSNFGRQLPRLGDAAKAYAADDPQKHV
ncbi:anti-sigma factor family protein [Sphingobium naphthae]|uniref:Zf-HC2 domain-containing protein n=1 Tax=Sphingobium naphthae TaxID=1886786 RepID=A0ABU4A0P1_9SPHN|nr:zf-HC2 domain-containing protein [Sphingobium naphthae]MDV5825339.1 zf-HC2 domain-containing protein [Sphingobium naphthae]